MSRLVSTKITNSLDKKSEDAFDSLSGSFVGLDESFILLEPTQLDVIPSLSAEEKVLKRFGSAELLGHIYGYINFDKEAPYNERIIKETNGSQSLYHGYQLQTEPGRGLYANVLIADTKPALKINFQGTDFFAYDGTLTADFRKGGAGFTIFHEQERTFLMQVAEHIRHISQRYPNQKISLDLSGHSLGGAYVQLAHNSILNAMANTKSFQALKLPSSVQKEFEKIGHIEANLANPAGVNRKIEKTLKKNNRSMREKFGLQTTANLLFVGGDPVQTHQATNAYADIAPEDMTVHLMKADIGYEGMGIREAVSAAITGATTIAAGLAPIIMIAPFAFGAAFVSKAIKGSMAHVATFFDYDDTFSTTTHPTVDFEYHANQTSKGRTAIKKECQCKTILGNAIVDGVHQIADGLSYIGGRFKSAASWFWGSNSTTQQNIQTVENTIYCADDIGEASAATITSQVRGAVANEFDLASQPIISTYYNAQQGTKYQNDAFSLARSLDEVLPIENKHPQSITPMF